MATQMTRVLEKIVRAISEELAESPVGPVASKVIYMTVREYADHRRVSESTIRRWLQLGLPAKRAKRVLRIIVEAADSWDADTAIRRKAIIEAATSAAEGMR
jgi:hypothetical protein